MTWFDTVTGNPSDSPMKKRRKPWLIDALPWITFAILLIGAVAILAPLLESGGRNPTTSTGYVGSLSLDPTMVGALETVAASTGLQESIQLTQVSLLVGIQPTATATPKSTATRNPTPQLPDCDVANVGDRCRFPPLRATVSREPTATTIPCSFATPDIYSQICIKDTNDGTGVD